MKVLTSIQIKIYPGFLILSLVFGMMFGRGWDIFLFSLLFSSVLFLHELGHVAVIRFFGEQCTLELSGCGGKTRVRERLPFFWQRMCAQSGGLFLTAFVASVSSNILPEVSENYSQAVFFFYVLNVGWFWLNLFPLYPLDMGEMMMDFLQTLLGTTGLRLSLIISCITACVLFGVSLFFHIMVGVYFALYSFVTTIARLQRPQKLDTEYSLEEQHLHEQYRRWNKGEQEEAVSSLYLLAFSAQEKFVRQYAVELCSKYLLILGRPREAFEVLKRTKDPLSIPSKEQFLVAAYRTSHWKEGLNSSRELFQIKKSLSIALISALFSARLHYVEESLGWLQAVWELGGESVKKVFFSHDFDYVKVDNK